jgi:ATP-dependent DNA helicase RecG
VADTFPSFESFELEYKSAAGGFPKDFWKTYSAFANTEGGFIVLGVKERGGKFVLEGLCDELIHQYKKIFWDNANNQNTVSACLLQESDVQEVDYDGVELLVFRIPSAIRTQKPVHLTRNPFGNTYKRNYEGDYVCSSEEVRRMLADADQKLHQDSRILEGFDLDDLDADALKKYRQLFANVKPSHPWLALADKEFLEKLGGYRKDRVTKKEGLTLAALLMFGKYESIIDQESAPNFFPDFREHLTNDEDARWSDRIYLDGTWECNLFNFYLKVWPKLSSSLPKPFLLEEGVRKDETPAHVALRESFINALIHTDFTAPGNIVIKHHKDHFSFLNPGTLLVTLHQYYEGGISECRNPSLQKMFLMVGTAEKAGSGVNKIMSGWEYAHWRRPFLRIENQPDRLVLELPMFSILPENILKKLKDKFGPQIDRMGKNDLTILATCAIEGEISNNRLQYLLDLHRTDITSLLQDLCKSSYLVSENRGRWTTYQLNSDFTENLSPKVDTSKVDTSKVDTSNSKPRKLSRDELQKQIAQLCSDEYKTLEEVSLLMGRSVDYLKNKIFPEMLDKGLLERLHPNINHPHQAYKSKISS